MNAHVVSSLQSACPDRRCTERVSHDARRDRASPPRGADGPQTLRVAAVPAHMGVRNPWQPALKRAFSSGTSIANGREERCKVQRSRCATDEATPTPASLEGE